MSFPHDDEFTRKLNERIKELENMTNEIDGKRDEINGFANKNSDETTELDDRATKAEDEATRLDDEAARLDDEAARLDDEAARLDDEAANQAVAPRQEGETIFFSAKVDSSQPLKLNITNNNGDVDVQGTDSDSVEIEATRVRGEEVDHSHWFFQQLDNEITLRPNWQVGSHVSDLASKLKSQLKEGFKTSEWSIKDFKFGLDVNYDLVVRLPKNLADGSRVNVKTANGDGQLRDVMAEVDFKTANGDLEVTNVNGALTINSANGDLRGTSVTGNVHASTANGDINLKSITGAIEGNTANGDVSIVSTTGTISVRTANGDVSLADANWKGGRLVTVAGDISVEAAMVSKSSYQFDSVSGSVHVTARVPEEGATFTAKTLSGEITAEGDLEKAGKREWKAGSGNGPRLSAKTVSADIEVTADIDGNLSMEEGTSADDEKSSADRPADTKRDGEVNVNVDFELERAKGWLKDMGGKLGAMLSEVDSKRADVVGPKEPKAPQAPEVPQPPISPEQSAATADRRTKLLEAVKNGEMTVDEALAELERDA